MSEEKEKVLDFPNLHLTLPVEVVRLALDLERQEFLLKARGDTLVVTTKDGSKPSLREDQASAIWRYKPHLLALVTAVEAAK